MLIHEGNYIQETVYKDKNLAWRVVVVQRVSCPPNFFQNVSDSTATCERCKRPYTSYGGAASECAVW